MMRLARCVICRDLGDYPICASSQEQESRTGGTRIAASQYNIAFSPGAVFGVWWPNQRCGMLARSKVRSQECAREVIFIGAASMMTLPELAADALEELLGSFMRHVYGSSQAYRELVLAAARIALECIGNSDALYHNVEHTMLVTLAGHDIMRGRALHCHTAPEDYAHLIIACLMHDIGYVRGVLKGDNGDGFVIDGNGGKITLPRGASDAALLPHHVDRSKLYVLDRLADMESIDEQRVARAIEFTRFPSNFPPDQKDDEEGSLLRAADLIGQ